MIHISPSDCKERALAHATNQQFAGHFFQPLTLSFVTRKVFPDHWTDNANTRSRCVFQRPLVMDQHLADQIGVKN
jgi:hypothetical protein